jgi:hypothetical protein
MTKEQIEIYEYCKADIQKLKGWKEKLPFGYQNHGCGSQDAKITFELEDIHREMYQAVCKAIEIAEGKINDKINKL